MRTLKGVRFAHPFLFFIHLCKPLKSIFMDEVLKQLLLLGCTSAISFFFAWLKKKADIKSIKNGSKSINDL